MVLFSHYTVVIPSQAVIQHHPGSYAKSVLDVETIPILISMAKGIAGVAEDAKPRRCLGNRLQQALKVVESDSSARVFVEALLNAGAAVLTSEFHFVLIHFPGKAVQKLIVRVHPLARIAGCSSQLRKEP